LNVSNERGLRRAAEKLQSAGISFRAFQEPDLDNSLTAIATEPMVGDKRQLFIGYPLMGADGYQYAHSVQKGDSQ